MIRLPLPLRLFWGAFALVALLVLIALPAGPALEEWLAPVRAPGARIESIGRSAAYLWFEWVGLKSRTPPSPGIDVTLRAAGDVFDLTLYNDESRPGEPRCTRIVPWARSRVVGVGPHRQAFCIEIPRTVAPADPVAVDVVPRYRGLAGLWELRAPFPPIAWPGATGTPRTP